MKPPTRSAPYGSRHSLYTCTRVCWTAEPYHGLRATVLRNVNVLLSCAVWLKTSGKLCSSLTGYLATVRSEGSVQYFIRFCSLPCPATSAVSDRLKMQGPSSAASVELQDSRFPQVDMPSPEKTAAPLQNCTQPPSQRWRDHFKLFRQCSKHSASDLLCISVLTIALRTGGEFCSQPDTYKLLKPAK